MLTSPREQPPSDEWFLRCRDMRTACWLVAWVALYGVLSATQFLIWLAAVGSLVMLVSNTARQGVATTFLCIALLAMFPLSAALSMYSFPTGSITWPALALALGAHFRKAD